MPKFLYFGQKKLIEIYIYNEFIGTHTTYS